jgi:hypothetical protein
MSTADPNSQECQTLFSLFKQRSQRAFYNIPGPRVTLVSPYPTFTQLQLDMRRKVEILKYQSSTSSTKTNNLTKAQKWSLLVNGGSQPAPQHIIANCPAGIQNTDSIPVLTTASDVPGPPMYLYLDPTVPLYNYIESRSYAISPPDAASWKSVTINELQFLSANLNLMPNDIKTNTQETRTVTFGSIIFTDNVDPTSSYVISQMNSPIGLFVDMIYGFGSMDGNGNYVPFIPFDVTKTNTISIQITDVELDFYYNDSLYELKTPPTINYSFQPLVVDCNQYILTHGMSSGQFYGIQYVGMLQIQNIVLPCVPNSVFDIKATIHYEYDHSLLTHFDAFQTGVFPNLTRENVNVTIPPMVFASSPPDGYISNTFVPYSAT